MIRLVVGIVACVFSLQALAKEPPTDIGLPTGPRGAPQSDCDQVLLDWDFATHKIVSPNKEHLFLMIDRYGGKRDFPDFRGTMCRISDMQEMWAVDQLFLNDYNFAFSPDGKYFANAIGRVFCSEENYDELHKLGALIFHKNGRVIKEYSLDELHPKWRETCDRDGVLRWMDGWYDMQDEGVSPNGLYFILETSDDVTHYFELSTGKRVDKPVDLGEKEEDDKNNSGFSFF